jgi:hypothetical protein
VVFNKGFLGKALVVGAICSAASILVLKVTSCGILIASDVCGASLGWPIPFARYFTGAGIVLTEGYTYFPLFTKMPFGVDYVNVFMFGLNTGVWMAIYGIVMRVLKRKS